MRRFSFFHVAATSIVAATLSACNIRSTVSTPIPLFETPTTFLATKTSMPIPPTETPVQPSPTPEAITDRPGHVWLADYSASADYNFRSFLQIPVGIVWGPDGYLYVADWAGHHVVKVDKNGGMDDLGLWQKVVSLQQDGPRGVAFDSHDNLYINNHGHIFRLDTAGNVEELSGIEGAPVGSIAINAADELYYTDRSDQGALRKWNPSGYSETIVSNLPFAENIAFGLDGSLYLTQMGQDNVIHVDVSTGEAREFLNGVCGHDPCFLAIDLEGDIWVRGINRLYQFTTQGVEKPFTIDSQAYPGGPYMWHTSAGIAFDDENGLWVASYNSKLLRLAPDTPIESDPEFSLEIISPGLEVSDLEIGPNGEIYAPDENSRQVLRIEPDGNVEVLLEYSSAGRVAVAVDEEGVLYLGMPYGELVRLEVDGSLSHYASLLTRRMVFGSDGALYTIVGDFGQPKSVIRITNVDEFTTITTEIDGIALGNREAHISPALEDGLYIFTEGDRNLFFVDFNGQGHLIANLRTLGGGGPAVMAASPVNGDIYLIPHGPYDIYRIDSDGKSDVIARGAFGDPWGMVVSHDGKWLHVAESGAIDKIPLIHDTP